MPKKLDSSVDRKLTDDWDYASIFSKVIGCELFHGSIADLYLRCRMGVASNVVQNEAPQFVGLRLLAVNTLHDF